MKTAISIPDDVFREAEAFAKRKHLSRSALYTAAVRSFVEQRTSREITKRLNDVYARQASHLDDALGAMQAASLPRESW